MESDDSDNKKDIFGVEDQDEVHVRAIQRRGKKYMTTVSGISQIFDFDKILKHWKKMMNCNGSIEEDEHDKTKQMIQISGDHRKQIQQFLLNEGIVLDKANLKIHGH